MKLIVFIVLATALCLTQASAQQFYGSADLGAGYRTKPITGKGGITTTDKQTTTILSINAGYLLHLENGKGAFNLLTEVNARLPILDGTNALNTGIKTGPMIPIGSAWMVPMVGAYYHFRSSAGTGIVPGAAIKFVFTSLEDTDWYIETSYINHVAGIGVGLFIRENKLF